MRQEEDSIFLSSLESLPKRQWSAVSISILHCIVVSCGNLQAAVLAARMVFRAHHSLLSLRRPHVGLRSPGRGRGRSFSLFA